MTANIAFTPEYLSATAAARTRELERLSQTREARRTHDAPAGKGRAWVWRVEPSMEAAFRSLRGWLLSTVDERGRAGGLRREGIVSAARVGRDTCLVGEHAATAGSEPRSPIWHWEAG